MNEAVEALYAGDVERGEALLPPDEQLDVFTAAALAAAFSDDGFTALHLAVYAGRAEAARLLLEHGADVKGEGEGGFTALDSAAANGYEDLVRLLESRGGERRVS